MIRVMQVDLAREDGNVFFLRDAGWRNCDIVQREVLSQIKYKRG